jgi:antitoxin YefM
MKYISYTKLRSNLAHIMDEVCDNHDPLVITRQDSRPVVLLSLEDFESIEETLYLMRNPVNAKRILDSLNSIELGNVKERDIIECD